MKDINLHALDHKPIYNSLCLGRNFPIGLQYCEIMFVMELLVPSGSDCLIWQFCSFCPDNCSCTQLLNKMGDYSDMPSEVNRILCFLVQLQTGVLLSPWISRLLLLLFQLEFQHPHPADGYRTVTRVSSFLPFYTELPWHSK